MKKPASFREAGSPLTQIIDLKSSNKYSRQRPTLPRTFARSTIGGGRLNFRVRNGNGCDPAPMTTGKLAAWGSDFARFASFVATSPFIRLVAL
jgi:hypothetical protein